jgi:hypothetical protein
MKKQTLIALVLLLLIPVASMLGGFLFSLINPEIAAGHPNYVQNFHFLSLLKVMAALTSALVVALGWLLICFLVIRSKERSSWWLFFAALGPFGFAILAMLDDKTPAKADRYARFVRSLNKFVRVAYEACIFVIIWFLAYEAMVFARNLIILYHSVATGMATAQIIDLQNSSSGMWAFGEGMEVMYMVVVLYLIWPLAFNIIGRVVTMMISPKPS